MKVFLITMFFALSLCESEPVGTKNTYSDLDPNLEKYIKDWSKYVSDIELNLYNIILLSTYDRKIIYVQVDKLPAMIRGLYNTMLEKTKLEFEVYDPEGNIIYRLHDLDQKIVHILVRKIGTYELRFTSHDRFSLFL